MKQRLGIGMALVGEPDVLVLDEPINGLDPEGIAEVRETLLRLNKEKGLTIIISSHILEELSKIATNYAIIDKGQLVKELSREELEATCREHIEIKMEHPDLALPVLDALGFKNVKNQISFLNQHETNMLITSDQKSGCVAELTDELNTLIEQTAALRKEIADNESHLKDTIINLSHDIRTPLTSMDGYFQAHEPIEASKVFDRFYKADEARSTTSTGLGLSIAKELVERLNGFITGNVINDTFTVSITFQIQK